MKILSSISPKILAAAAILVCGASTVLANQSQIFLEVGKGYGEVNPYQYGDGGEFTALTTNLGSGSQVPAGYATDATFKVNGVTGFETFCIEDQVDFYVGQTYNVSENSGTAKGSVQQSNSIGFLSAGVAWLYEQFATGQLKGYNYFYTPTRLIDAGELQATLWYLEGEPADANVDFNQATDPFTQLVIKHFGTLAKAQAVANSSYGVKVLELTDPNSGAIAQDQLIYCGPNVSVPDGGSTVALLGASLLAFALLRRRLVAA